MEEAFSIIVEEKAFDQVYVVLAGRVSMDNAERVRKELVEVAMAEPLRDMVVDLKNVSYLDSSGAAILLELKRKSGELGNTLKLTNIPPRIQGFLELMETQQPVKSGILRRRSAPNIFEHAGAGALQLAKNARDIVMFVGSVAVALFQDLSRPSKLKWDDLWKLIERSGADAIPIVTILSFLMGAVLAFQAAIQLRKFGANIFVADLVSLSICLEMGPLLTAVIVSGRSGAAYAAHIGTMQVNEEIDALYVMAIDPIRYLVVPRVLAVAFALPCLTLFADLVGMAGGCLVAMFSLDLTPTAYFDQIRKVLEVSDVIKGLMKSLAFGIEIAMVGCLRGFQVRGGAESVGVATTSAVVTCVFLLTVTDAVFSMLYYYLPSIGN